MSSPEQLAPAGEEEKAGNTQLAVVKSAELLPPENRAGTLQEKITEIEGDKLVLDVDIAREAYIKAQGEYENKNSGRAGNILNIGGDTKEVDITRAAYEQALKDSATKERGEHFDSLSPEQKAFVTRDLFNKFVVGEEQKLNQLRAEHLPHREKSTLQKAWSWYAAQPRWKKIAISTAVGAGVAWGSGAVAGAGVLAYAGQRVARSWAGAKAGAYAGAGMEMGFAAWDKTKWGEKNTKEYQIQELVHGHADTILNSLGEMREDYRAILDKQTATEKRRAGWKIAAAVVAGAGTSATIGFESAHHAASAAAVVEHPHAGGAIATPEHPHPLEIHERGVTQTHENVPPAHSAVEVQKGDSLWKITNEQLSKDNETFRGLDAAQKTYVINALTHQEAGAHITGLEHTDSLAVGAKLDLSHVLNDKEGIAKLLEHAKNLSDDQRDSIMANNQAIAEWMHAHPTEHLTGARTEEILHGDHPAQVELAEPKLHLEHDASAPEPITAAQAAELGGTPDTAAVEAALQHHPANVALSVEGFAKELGQWNGTAGGGKQILESWRHLSASSPEQAHHYLETVAQKVGDHYPPKINPADHAAVQKQMENYLVAYPEAQKLGFTEYKTWAGIKDVPVKQFMNETMIRPTTTDMQSALKHSFFHPGSRISAFARGTSPIKTPLKDYHIALRRALDLSGANGDTNETLGTFMAQHSDAIDGHLSEALRMKTLIHK